MPVRACVFASWSLLALLPGSALANQETSPADLKRLSIGELLDMEVTSVSRRPERIGAAASAIQLITGDNIRRSGATSLPEALRLAPNLQVAQVNSSQWAITARGFNNVLANKLLVQIDGRTVYTPLYAGVFWDAQDYLLADIDRMEVVSGPGGTLWGANAVNGIINITTRSAAETSGLFLSAGGGQELRSFAEARYGGALSEAAHYRVYGKYADRDETEFLDGTPAGDAWQMKQAGFRTDFRAGDDNRFTLQGDVYDADPNPDGVDVENVSSSGGNVLGRWRRQLGPDSELQLRLYADRTRRDFGSGFREDLDTWDIELQHRLPCGDRQEIVWGAGARLMQHETRNVPGFEFLPARMTLHLYNAFVQDELAAFDDRLRITVGSKFEHNDYTGFEYQPSVRAAWSFSDRDTLWSAVSRAVRTPARIERDFRLSLAPGLPILVGDPEFEAEELLSAELGWRSQFTESLSWSIAGFYSEYDNLRSVQPGPPPFFLPIMITNDVIGETYGLEFSALARPTNWWRLRGGYTLLRKQLVVKDGRVDLNAATAESSDARHSALLHSMMDLGNQVELDLVARYVDSLPHTTASPDPHVESYIELDLRLNWEVVSGLEVAVVGTNLLDDGHGEFVPSSPAARLIERGVHGRMTWRFR